MKDSKKLMHQCKIVGTPAERSVFCEDFSKGGFLGGETSNIFYFHPYLWKINPF